MKLQMTPRFPALVIGAGNITVTLLNGVYTISDQAVPVLRIITAAGPVTVEPADNVIALNKAVGEATQVLLPPAASRNGLELIVKDLKGDAAANNITVVPTGVEVIDIIHTSDVLDVNLGARTYRPIANGWLRT